MENKYKKKLIKKKRKLAQWRDSQLCSDCGGTRNLTLHHIHHKGEGGEDIKKNLIVLCRKCHHEEHKDKGGLNRSKWSEQSIYDLMELKKCGFTYDELADVFDRTKFSLQTMVHNIKFRVDKVSSNI